MSFILKLYKQPNKNGEIFMTIDNFDIRVLELEMSLLLEKLRFDKTIFKYLNLCSNEKR